MVNKKSENADLVYNNLNFNKVSVSDIGFNKLFDDTKYKHLQKMFQK